MKGIVHWLFENAFVIWALLVVTLLGIYGISWFVIWLLELIYFIRTHKVFKSNKDSK